MVGPQPEDGRTPARGRFTPKKIRFGLGNTRLQYFFGLHLPNQAASTLNHIPACPRPSRIITPFLEHIPPAKADFAPARRSGRWRRTGLGLSHRLGSPEIPCTRVGGAYSRASPKLGPGSRGRSSHRVLNEPPLIANAVLAQLRVRPRLFSSSPGSSACSRKARTAWRVRWGIARGCAVAAGEEQANAPGKNLPAGAKFRSLRLESATLGVVGVVDLVGEGSQALGQPDWRGWKPGM